jgi:hypothetical protein
MASGTPIAAPIQCPSTSLDNPALSCVVTVGNKSYRARAHCGARRGNPAVVSVRIEAEKANTPPSGAGRSRAAR